MLNRLHSSIDLVRGDNHVLKDSSSVCATVVLVRFLFSPYQHIRYSLCKVSCGEFVSSPLGLRLPILTL